LYQPAEENGKTAHASSPENGISPVESIKTIHTKLNQLTPSFSYKDKFHAVINDADCTKMVKNAAMSANLDFVTLDRGSSGSEDFGRLMDASRKGGALFSLGAGEKHPNLHTPAYDFNDGILLDGVNIFVALIDAILGFEPSNG